MTLENGKNYGLKDRVQTLQDVSRSRLNGPTPHQANQRERASLAQTPGGSSRGPRRRHRRWTDFLAPDRNMGVPQLMMMLEPNIVWDHTIGYYEKLGKNVESSYCPGEFFEGWHKAGRLAHGVYEGSYWELIGDCDEMIDMLKKMSRAPPLQDEPTLNLPASPDLPKWEDFKPQLQALPSAPQLPQLKLPAFRAPLLDTEVPFMEPEYLTVPDVPAAAKEEPVPDFCAPQLAVMEPFEAPEYVQPEPPPGSEQPHAPTIGKAQHGHDWTGERPFVVSEPAFQQPKMLDVPSFQHPPKHLPKLPLMEDLTLDRPDLDMDAVPRMELAWECGPEPEPSYASIATPARLASPPRSPQLRSRPASAVKAPDPLPAPAPSPAPAPAPAAPVMARARSSGLGALPAPPPAPTTDPSPALPPAAAWEDVVDVDAGKPRLWLNFEKPFAELPPIFMPPEPQLYEINGPEPKPEDFPHDALESEPPLVVPEEQPLPVWNPPQLRLPRWVPPCEPRPIGFLRGTAPVLILDVSGTMNPRLNGRFHDMKACVVELLQPEGELATAAGAFDVINFCSGAWSWSATYDSRMQLLATSQTFHSGRQAGGKPRPGSSVAEKTKLGGKLQPTEPDMLADAANWVAKWPDAVGHTAMLAAFLNADEHWSADCWYIFSDGQADDPSQCTAFLEARMKHGLKVPVIHTIGFFPEGSPENFDGRRYLQLLSQMTGGVFQEYDRNLHRVFQEGVGFVPYNIAGEVAEDRAEREWAEAQLRAERKKNIALGIAERYEVTLARVAVLHKQTRIQTAAQQYEDGIADMRLAYQERTAEVHLYNAGLAEQARAEHVAAVAGVQQRNKQRLAAARYAYEAAHAEWRRVYDDALAEWRQLKATLEVQRTEAMAALNQAGRSRSPSRPSSRVVSRPTSAATQSPSHSLGTGVSTAAVAEPAGTAAGLAPGVASPASASRPQSASRLQTASRPTSARASAARDLVQVRGSAVSVSGRLSATREDLPWVGPAPSSGSNVQPDSTASGSGASGLREKGGLNAATSTPEVAAASQAVDDDADAGIIQDEAGDEVGVLGDGSIPHLDGEDSDEELRRQIFPAEVVRALDEENEAALTGIRDEWRKLLKDTDARNSYKLAVVDRNKDVVDKYCDAVLSAYASGYVTDVLHGACVRVAANDLALAAAEKAHKTAVDKIRDHNAKTAAAHAAEVAEKVRKEEHYVQATARWKDRREELARQYEADIATARKHHAENVAQAQQDWDNKKEEMAAVNDMRMADAQARHEKLLEEIRQLNLKHRVEHQEQVKAKKAAEAENAARLTDARTAHKVRLELLKQENAARLISAQVEHQALCARLGEEHEEAKVSAQQEYEDLRAFLMQHNEALLAEARAKYQEALAQVQAEFDELCAQISQQHSTELERVRRRNQEIWPQVQVARLALAELGRVQAFAEHIKYCANKYVLGVNFMPNTPNYDRVVEMQALTESLLRAFPDYASNNYPWPDHERKGEPGTGWVASPQPMSLSLRDPAVEIQKLAIGKSRSAGSSRGPSSGAQSPTQSASPSRTPRGVFLTAEASGVPLAGGTWAGAGLPPRPATAVPGGGSANGRHRPVSARHDLRRSESGLVPGANRPQSARPQPRDAPARASQQALADNSARQLLRPESAGRMRFSNLVQPESNGPATTAWVLRPYSGSSSPSPLAAAATGAGAGTRPVSARSQQGGSRNQQKQRPASASSRPPSAGRQHLPARVAAKLNGMQFALSAMQATSATSAGSPVGRPPVAGFVRDLPRLQYTEIDVKALK